MKETKSLYVQPVTKAMDLYCALVSEKDYFEGHIVAFAPFMYPLLIVRDGLRSFDKYLPFPSSSD